MRRSVLLSVVLAPLALASALAAGPWDGTYVYEQGLGSGDGGIYSTAADITALWQSLFTGKIVPAAWVAEMVRARSDVPSESMRYGLGFWLGRHDDTVILEGFDAGVSFRSVHDPRSSMTHTVISNSSDGAWPITRCLDELLAA